MVVGSERGYGCVSDYNIALALLREGNSEMMRRLKPDVDDLIDEIMYLIGENDRLEDDLENCKWELTCAMLTQD